MQITQFKETGVGTLPDFTVPVCSSERDHVGWFWNWVQKGQHQLLEPCWGVAGCPRLEKNKPADPYWLLQICKLRCKWPEQAFGFSLWFSEPALCAVLWCFVATMVGFFSTIIYSCKMYLEQFPQSHKIHLCSVSFLKCSVQQDQRLMERGKFNQISATLFLQSWCFFPSKLRSYQKLFYPWFSWQYIKVISWLNRQKETSGVSLLCSLCPLLHETQLSLK